MRTVSGSPGRVEGRSGSSRAVRIRSCSRRDEPAHGEDAEVRGLAREHDDLLQVRDLRLAAPRAGEGGQDARLVVEALDAARARRGTCAAGAGRRGARGRAPTVSAPGAAASRAPAPRSRARRRRARRTTMSRSLTPQKDERSAATRETRSEGSSSARSTARTSCTSWRSKNDLPPSIVKRSPADSSASSSGRICVSRRARTMTSPARLGRSTPVCGSRTSCAARRDLGQEARRGRAPPRAAGPRPSAKGASKRSAMTDGVFAEPGRRRDRLVGGLAGLVGGGDQRGEGAVHEAQDGGARAEVLGEVQHAVPWPRGRLRGRCAGRARPPRGGSGRSTAWRRRPRPARPGAPR